MELSNAHQIQCSPTLGWLRDFIIKGVRVYKFFASLEITVNFFHSIKWQIRMVDYF